LKYITDTVGNEKVLMAVSGGVDSTVAASLIRKAIGRSRLKCIFIDHGMMREGEGCEVMQSLSELDIDVDMIECKHEFLSMLANISDPECKRKCIGFSFIYAFNDYVKKIESEFEYLAQGTIYPDVIESSGRRESSAIKSHHNVGGLPKDLSFKLVEPLRNLFKDEVRRLGEHMGVPDSILKRHPFPGPGLGIRVIGLVDEFRLHTLRVADEIFINCLREEKLYDKIWQAGAVLLPVKSVGVMGDQRTYEEVVCLRAVNSVDGMTASCYPFDIAFLTKVSTKIINSVPNVNRVMYDISTKPPATIEWE